MNVEIILSDGEDDVDVEVDGFYYFNIFICEVGDIFEENYYVVFLLILI